jgi:hypothetical protein
MASRRRLQPRSPSVQTSSRRIPTAMRAANKRQPLGRC